MSAIDKGETTASPMSDLMYDWIAILHSKGKGLQAYEKYLADARRNDGDECVMLLEKLRDQDTAMVREVKEHVAKMMSHANGQAKGQRTSAGASPAKGKAREERAGAHLS